MTAAERSDADLLRAHAAGDASAFEDLVRRHRDRLWAVALRTTRDREEAADALQDALISAYKAAGSFRGESAVTTWLHRIVVNACLDRMRRRQTRATGAAAGGGATSRPTAGTMAERDTRMVVEEALGQLPVEQRAAIVLVDVEGWSVAETAAMLGVPEGTVVALRPRPGLAGRVARPPAEPGRARARRTEVRQRGGGEMTADERRTGPPTGHADLDTLADLQAGVLEGPRADRVREHVAGCRSARRSTHSMPCRASLRSLPAPAMPAAVAARLTPPADLARRPPGSGSPVGRPVGSPVGSVGRRQSVGRRRRVGPGSGGRAGPGQGPGAAAGCPG